MRTIPEKSNTGMTAIELVIVVGIFSIIASTAFLNFGRFQGKVDLKNLTNDIALKIVEAQRSSSAGKWNSGFGTNKPSYGVLFNTSFPTKFAYFGDFDNSDSCSGSQCTSFTVGGEVLDVINITKGNTISSLGIVGSGCSTTTPSVLSIVFRRPNTSPVFTSSPSHNCNPVNITINVTSPKSLTAIIRAYASGYVQIN